MFVKFTCRLFRRLPLRAALLQPVLLGGLLIGTPAFAQKDQPADIPAKREGSAYQQDSGGLIVRSSDGLCWRAGFWTPDDAVAGCDGSLAPPISKIIAPPVPAAPEPVDTTDAAPSTIPTRPAVCEFEITLSGDQSFAFDSAELSADARRQLDEEVLPRLDRCPPATTLRVTGHTDRLGSAQYNRQLSLRRAQAVADYLSQQGKPLSIERRGAGASQAQQRCENQPNKQALLACLAPDRRVTIEVRGTPD